MSDEIKVVRGNPTAEELAAALAVVQARAASAANGSRSGRGGEWADPERRVLTRRTPRPGPKAWRTTYWPA
ncbi:acyl-CoA carboxylase epsilon subunit [Streptomyces sp. 184]|uniref:acyl-CoA carboxylase epsilon subunit n=1 Tax=Streptomyces sp. 184 TaxID=1827526 RepID=UPI003891AB63